VKELDETLLIQRGVEYMKKLTAHATPGRNEIPYGKGPRKLDEVETVKKIMEARWQGRP
jgi:hypothetical protein